MGWGWLTGGEMQMRLILYCNCGRPPLWTFFISIQGPHIWSLPMRAVLPKWAALYMSPLLSWTVTEVMAGGLVAILVLFQIPLR